MTTTPDATARPRLPDTLRGALAILGATLGMASGFGLLILSSIFMTPLVDHFGWSRADVSLGYVAAAMGMAVGGLVWGRVSDRLDLRWMLALGGVCQVLPLVWLSGIGSIGPFLAAHALLGFFGFGALYAPYVAVASDWFPARRGLVMGIVTAGGAVGQGVLPYLSEALIAAQGWRQAYLDLALIMAVIQSAVFLTLRYRTARPAGRNAATAGATVLTPRLITLGAAAFFCCACMGMPLVHLAGFVAMICGSANLGATSLLIAMISGTIGRIAFGLLADRIGNLPTYRIAAFGQGASLLFFPELTGTAPLMVLSALFGFAFSGNMTCMLLCIRQEAPPQRLGAAIGGILFVAWAGMGVGGYLGGAVFDTLGSYDWAFRTATGFGFASFLLLSALDHAPGPLRRTGPGAVAA